MTQPSRQGRGPEAIAVPAASRVSPVQELSVVAEANFPGEWYEIAAEGHFWIEWRFRAFLHQLDALHVPRSVPWRGLDIGCGHGLVRRQIERCSDWVTDGADLKRDALSRNATERGETYLYDIHDRRPEFRERYDFVLLFDVLEHIEDPQPFLASALYHLKPGGWVFMDMPALQRLHSRFDEVVGHLRRYNRRTLRAELARQPLVIRSLRYWGFSMLPYLAARKLMSRRESSVKKVIERGHLPPRPWMTRWILRLMELETAWLRTPVIGTSLLVAGVKTRAQPTPD